MYFISTFEKVEVEEEFGWADVGAWTTVGYFSTFAEAEERVINNILDIWETIYNYAVIEYILSGLYSTSRDTHFYKYNIKTNKYDSIDRPAGLSEYRNFALI